MGNNLQITIPKERCELNLFKATCINLSVGWEQNMLRQEGKIRKLYYVCKQHTNTIYVTFSLFKSWKMLNKNKIKDLNRDMFP